MLVDTHAHLMDDAYGADLAEVLERAAAADVTTIVCVGYDLASSRQAVGLAAQDARLHAAVGVHPNYLAEAPADWLIQLGELARAPRVVAIGETGLDYYRTYTPHAAQREGFVAQMALAAERDLPIVIHCRDAEADLLDLLERTSARPATGVWHCFSGTVAQLHTAVRLGLYISFAGTVTFCNAAALREAGSEAPADRLLVETDCP
jgi:TatD DNase family protein